MTDEQLDRRELLRIGSLGLGGLALPSLLTSNANAAQGRAIRDKSVVLLFLMGGASQIETFDPKMTAPAEYRSVVGEVKTSIPGVTFGGVFPRLAQLAHRMAIVRSFAHVDSDHGTSPQLIMSGHNPTKAAMGPIYARLAGTTNRQTGMPHNVLIGSKSSGDSVSERVANVGELGDSFRSFVPNEGGDVLDNMRLKISPQQLGDRRTLLDSLDRFRSRLDGWEPIAVADEVKRQALDLLLANVADAFDVSREDPRTIEMYDTSQIQIVPRKGANLVSRCIGPPKQLGQQMLLTRRLCEAGCGFVTVCTNDWDMHGFSTLWGIEDGFRTIGPHLDRAISAFLTDVEERGLSEKILLIITGDFGRSPMVSPGAKEGDAPGRGHWPKLSTLAFAGGGLRMGQVIGQSDRIASEPASEPVTVEHLAATVMHTMFDLGRLRLIAGMPTEVLRWLEAIKPIAELL